MGGWCRGQKVDISRREEVYKAAAELKNNFGDVSGKNDILKKILLEPGGIRKVFCFGAKVKIERSYQI